MSAQPLKTVGRCSPQLFVTGAAPPELLADDFLEDVEDGRRRSEPFEHGGVTENGTYSLGFANSNPSYSYVCSRDSSNPPVLEVTYEP
ncbi:MAG TPA: hypothetical protein VNJ70_09040 [Thermoanaerobaculia bacterium]|nr:hypothetical protein [Thermoanaerobaculia bacterium]